MQDVLRRISGGLLLVGVYAGAWLLLRTGLNAPPAIAGLIALVVLLGASPLARSIMLGQAVQRARYLDVSDEGLRPSTRAAIRRHEELLALGFRRAGEYQLAMANVEPVVAFGYLDPERHTFAEIVTTGSSTAVHFETVFGENAVLETIAVTKHRAETITNHPTYTQQVVITESLQEAFLLHQANIPLMAERHGTIRVRSADFGELLRIGETIFKPYTGPWRAVRGALPVLVIIAAWIVGLGVWLLVLTNGSPMLAALNLAPAQRLPVMLAILSLLFAALPIPLPDAAVVPLVVYRVGVALTAVLALLPVGQWAFVLWVAGTAVMLLFLLVGVMLPAARTHRPDA
ncbi:MAG: hypothetical protein GYB64_17655 [Chloroflexi bacterium]|nr:hypothetical protein [Chloroflexota bacterium]